MMTGLPEYSAAYRKQLADLLPDLVVREEIARYRAERRAERHERITRTLNRLRSILSGGHSRPVSH